MERACFDKNLDVGRRTICFQGELISLPSGSKPKQAAQSKSAISNGMWDFILRNAAGKLYRLTVPQNVNSDRLPKEISRHDARDEAMKVTVSGKSLFAVEYDRELCDRPIKRIKRPTVPLPSEFSFNPVVAYCFSAFKEAYGCSTPAADAMVQNVAALYGIGSSDSRGHVTGVLDKGAFDLAGMRTYCGNPPSEWPYLYNDICSLSIQDMESEGLRFGPIIGN